MFSKKIIYFDNAATTKVDDRVLNSMLKYFDKDYGNASSKHELGRDAKSALEKSRRVIARSLGAKPEEIVFTSGGTESNNLAIKGMFFSAKEKSKNHFITTKIEHDCVYNAGKWLESQGCDVTFLNVDSEGFIDFKELEKSITDKTFLVSIIHGNNEIGTIQDVEKIGELCKRKGVAFHIDACQSYTKIPIDVKKQNLSLVTLNAHKIHGPKGVGALYVKEGLKITPIAHGGGHERNLRSGTENIPGIVGFAAATESIGKKEIKKMEEQRDRLIEGLLKIENVYLNGPKERLCNNVNISLGGVEGELVGSLLEDYGFLTSVGSACMSHSSGPSHVLKALGQDDVKALSSMRISISKYTTDAEIEEFLKVFPKVLDKARKVGRGW